MYIKTSIALLAATLAMTAMDSSAFARSKRLSANGGDGGSGNVVFGDNNRVGNGGRGGNIASFGGGFGRSRLSANGGDGGSGNLVIGNGNRVGNGGNGGNILDFDEGDDD